MATNEQIRRAIGANNEAARRSFADDLNRLVSPSGTPKALKTIDPRGARAAKRGVSTYTPPATGTGGGIAGPLNESTTKAREYYDPVLLPTTDGLAWVKWKGVKKITMIDGNNAEVPVGFVNALSE